jgi:hypothetical protein
VKHPSTKHFEVSAWSAWAPGLATRDEWLQWAREPVPPPRAGAPELKFVPAMVRRRFSRLSKIALQVAFDATPPELLTDVCSVFATRHGEANACVSLLSDIARGTPLSPTAFSHSVHNTQSGLFSISAGNGCTSSAIGAGRHTFAAGLIEALAVGRRNPGHPVLLVIADEPFPEVFQAFEDEHPCAFGLALLLEPSSVARPRFTLEFPGSIPGPGASARELPQALRFLAWMLQGQGALELGLGGRSLRLSRTTPPAPGT